MDMRRPHARSSATDAASRGMIGLLTVIVIGAVTLAVGIAASFIGQTQLTVAGYVDRGHLARTLAATCLEEATFRLKLNANYAGGTVPIDELSCTVTVAGTGSTRTVTATATVDGHTKTLVATATLLQNASFNARAWTLSAWAEQDPP
jgi:hypothetical protein